LKQSEAGACVAAPTKTYAVVILGAVASFSVTWVTPALSATTSPAPDRNVVATIGQQRVTEADVLAQGKTGFDTQERDYHRQLRQLQSTYDEARQQLLQQQLDSLLDRRALELEAQARGASPEKILSEIQVPAVTDAEVRAFYDANKSRTTQTFEELATPIKQYLASQHNDQATRAFYQSLRSKHAIASRLEPYRVAVGASGAVRGPANAPITIVEFGDFQCPYCQQEEATLRSVMTKYEGKVRLVFRHLPLTKIHPNAMAAAQAAVCADRQGKFWDMHDALYADQNALGADAIRDTAGKLGLDLKIFSACLSDDSTARAIDSDVSQADELGVAATPSFFINGRPLRGSVPADKFEAIIAEELQHTSGSRG